MTIREAEDFGKHLLESVKSYVERSLVPVAARLNELAQKIADIPAGAKGDKGDAGEKGEKGDRGLTGDKGELGPKGDQGEPGIPGAKGETGEKGAQGLAGERGEKGIDGKDGRDGRDGIAKDGRDGEPGRDAIQIEILPAINPDKSYPRGTFASAKGGILRFDGHEWHCIVRGIDYETEELSEDFRTRTRKTFYSDGTVKDSSSRSPVLIYREIFRDGAEYTKGDVVTYDSSAWHCQVDSTKAKPGVSPDWKLMVRKGGNGKDGKDGERGKEGPPGKDFRPLGAKF